MVSVYKLLIDGLEANQNMFVEVYHVKWSSSGTLPINNGERNDILTIHYAKL